MPDITLCDGKGCSLKESCWRYKATPNRLRQSYFSEAPVKNEGADCDYYWEDEKDDTESKTVSKRSKSKKKS